MGGLGFFKLSKVIATCSKHLSLASTTSSYSFEATSGVMNDTSIESMFWIFYCVWTVSSDIDGYSIANEKSSPIGIWLDELARLEAVRKRFVT